MTESVPIDVSKLSFEQIVEQLEQITRMMAAGDIGIEAVADLYEQAGRLHAEAAERLEGVRRRLGSLTDESPGEAETQPGERPT